MPKNRAITTPSTDAQTDAAPLMPHRNAVGEPGCADAARIPITNGMPMTRASGARRATATAMRHGVVQPSVARSTTGVRKPAPTTTAASATSGASWLRRSPVRRNRSVSRLPIPLNTSTENSETVRP